MKRFLQQLRSEAAADGGRFFRLMLAVAVIFLVGAVLAIGRILWAMSHGVVWVNFRGSALTRRDMYTALALSAAVAALSVVIVVSLLKSQRQPPQAPRARSS